MSNYTDALRILRKDDEEERNWRSAKQQLGELFQKAEEAVQTLATYEQRKTRLEADIEALSKRQQDLNATCASVLAKLNTLEPDLLRRQQMARGVLDQLDAEIANKRAELDEKKVALEQFRAKLGMA